MHHTCPIMYDLLIYPKLYIVTCTYHHMTCTVREREHSFVHPPWTDSSLRRLRLNTDSMAESSKAM